MAYVLGQYNLQSGDIPNFMTQVATAEGAAQADRIETGRDEGTSSSEPTIIFMDECLTGFTFSTDTHYYFHGKIERMKNSTQKFDIKLCYKNGGDIEQYIKTVTVSKGDQTKWVDVEFIFTPMASFDCLLFELQRTTSDFRDENRSPKIAYIELSTVNNIISSIDSTAQLDTKLIKLGVQSRPGLLMCINGEEIHTCRTGVYEIKNGVITVSFFSVVNGLEENNNILSNWMRDTGRAVRNIDDNDSLTPAQKEEAKANIPSRCFFSTSKKPREIDSFTLDYLYKTS